MAATRPELSEKSKWWIGKHRYYELRHFCLQYPDWVSMIRDIDGLPSSSPERHEHINEGRHSDPTAVYVEVREFLTRKINLVEKAAFEASNHQFWYTILLEAVTTGASYDILEARKGIMPVSRNEWYDVYRKFFWYLDKLRD